MTGKKPKILLVQPTTVHLDGTPHKSRWRLIMGLMIPLMAGLTPDEYDVTLCDERLEEINWDGGWDLVGMTTTIGASLRYPCCLRRFSRDAADRRSAQALRCGRAGRSRSRVAATPAGLARRQAQAGLQVRQGSRSEESAAPSA